MTRSYLTGGYRGGNTSDPDAGAPFIVVLNSSDGSWIDDRILDALHGSLLDCKVVTVDNKDYLIFTGTQFAGDENWIFEVFEDTPNPGDHLNSDGISVAGNDYKIRDQDVVIGKLPIDNLDDGFILIYDGKDYDYGLALEDSNHPGASYFSNPNPNIWEEPDCEDQYGPCTPGKSVSGWGYNGDGSLNGSPVVDAYLGNNSWDEGKSIIYHDGYLYVAAELNTFQFTGTFNAELQQSLVDGGKGVVLKDHCGEDVQILGYKDAYIHLMKLELDGDLVDVKNVAHFSGGDFYASIVVDQTDGNIVLSGTTADKDICGLPDVDDCLYAVNTLIKLDADDLDMIWQQHYNAYGEGNCAFGLIQTADGGFVQVGNNELDEGETETFNIVRYTPDCQAGATFDLDGDHTLTSDETWNGSNKPDPYRIRGNVIIPNTKKLTISGITVEFAGTKNTPGNTKSGITVEGGGRLIVNDGAVLKGIDCGGEQMWDGITALGSPTSAYGGNQAVVVLTGDAVIENALRGVVLGGTAWENVESVVPPPTGSSVGTLLTNTYRDDQAYGGGRLFAAGAGFLNCARGVVWNPQPNYSNLSALYDVDFAFTGPLADPLYKPASDALGAPILAEMGCRLRSVRDITFEGCTFINSASGGLFDYQRQRPSGMYATDSKFSFVAGSADPNFELLYIGIEGNAGFGGLPATMNISGKFSQVYQGLVLRNNIAPYVSGSSFSLIPDVADSDDGDPAGIHAVGTQGITLTDNTFDSDAGYKSYGTHINNSLGNGGAKVEFNTFTDFYVANRFEKDNSSLQTHCNTYTGDVGDFSWEVRGTLANQINIANSSYFPDNKFLWTCGSPLLDITSQNALSYYERAQTLTNSGSILLCYDNQVTVIPGTGLPTSPNCTLEDPCPDPPNCSTLATQYAGNDKALTDRNDLLNAYVRMGNRAVSDSLYLPGMTRAIDLLEDRDEQEDKRILTATYAALEDYTAAETELGDVDDTDDETADFIALYTVLIDAGKDGRDAYHLNAADFEAIAELMDHNTAAAEQVRVIDHIVNGNYHPLFVEQDEARPAEREESGFQGSIPAAGILVSPNPFIKTVRFTAPTGAGIQYLTISDPHGQVLYRHTSRTGETTMTWKPEKLPQGLYFYTCRLSNGEVQNGKLAKTDQ